jgi:RNA polymerase sigma-70 factor (ECF subfamily)
MQPPPNNSLLLESLGLGRFLSIRRAEPLITGKVKSDSEARPTPDIARLTHQMAKGDEEAFREFHEAYFGRLLGYLLVVTRDEQLAREALQATLLRVVRYGRKFESEEAFWSWLTVLARSSLADERRRATRYASFLDRFFQRTVIESDIKIDETRSRLKEALEINLAALPIEDRELLERKYFEHQSVREIAQTTELSDKAIESRLTRIRQKLRDMVLTQLKHEG